MVQQTRFASTLPAVSRFLGSLESPTRADVLLMGVPFDGSVSFWPGARFAPARIREASCSLEEYSPMLDKSLAEVQFFDAGDIELPFGDLSGTLSCIAGTVRKEALEQEKRPFVLGGEHLVSLPVIQAIHELYPDLAVVHLDAHADMRDTYLGVRCSHATVMKRVSDIVGPENVYQFGIRSGSKDEWVYAKEKTRFYPYEVLQPLREVLPELEARLVYVTLDIDVIDPGFAPGTGTPEPGGCTPHEIIEALHQLAVARVIGFDLVEVCPAAESGVATSVLAAKLVREALLSFA